LWKTRGLDETTPGFSTNKYYLKKIQSKTTTKNNPWVFNKQILSQQNPGIVSFVFVFY
jgi:hypothetical protein